MSAWILSVLSGGLQILIFPKISLPFLCWVAMVPLLYALLRGRGGEGEARDSEGRSLRPFTLWQGFLIAWASGLIWYLGTCYWVFPVMTGYGGLNALIAGLITLAAGFAMGLHHAVFGLLVVLMSRRSTLGNRRPLLLAPVFWVAIELFRDRITGFPWNLLGYSQVDNIPFARISQLTGVYGLSFAVMLVNCAFVAALLLPGRRRTNLLISAGAAAIALQIGIFAKPEAFVTSQEAVLVQQNISLDQDWKPQFFDQTLSSLVNLSVSASARRAPGNPGLIVWPESPAPFFIADPKLQHWLTAMAQDTGSYLVIGSLGQGLDARGEPQLSNSALIMDPNGQTIGRYDKVHLVPFGEYVPFHDILFFARKLTREVGNYARGTERKVFDLNGTRAGVLICYESVFPNEVREFTANGAHVLINISDDLWYGESGAPFQHLQMARMRAMENHRWLLLTTNSGTTASIDPFGRIVKRAERNVRTALVVPFAPQNASTFYSRNGDVFAWVCVVISCLAVFVRLRFTARTMIEARST